MHNGNNAKDGTDLGLVISTFLIKEMGGGISCESVVGDGTAFLVTFVYPGTMASDGNTRLWFSTGKLLLTGTSV